MKLSENNLRPYSTEPWFLALTKEQQVVYETRIGSLCEDGPVNQAAHWIAFQEAKDVKK